MSGKATRILVVDDELAIRRFLRASLTPLGYDVDEAATGEEALVRVAGQPPDVIVLDLRLPGIDGIEVTRRLREWTQVPILVLSVQDQDQEKIAALDAGADDYLTKPFSVGELTARLRVALRHASAAPAAAKMEIGQLHIDFVARLVTCRGATVQLTPTEYDLLRILAQNAGRVLTHQQLLRQVRGIGYQTETHLLRVHISNLRRKIELDPTDPQYLHTEPGVGYRLAALT